MDTVGETKNSLHIYIHTHIRTYIIYIYTYTYRPTYTPICNTVVHINCFNCYNTTVFPNPMLIFVAPYVGTPNKLPCDEELDLARHCRDIKTFLEVDELGLGLSRTD